MKKILVVMGTMGMGGAETSLISFMKLLTPEVLRANELTIDFLVPDVNGELMTEVPSHINVIRAPYIFTTYALSFNTARIVLKSKIIVPTLKVLFKIKSALNKNGLSGNENYWKSNEVFIPVFRKQYDVCLAYMNGTATYYAIDKIKAIRKIVWIHNEYEQLKYTDCFQEQFYRKADAIVTISDRCVDSFLRHFPEFKNKVFMIENISSAKVILEKANLFYPKEYLGKEDKVKIVSVGRLTSQKGFDVGIKSMNILFKDNIEFEWYIVGEGEDRALLQELIDAYGLQDRIHLMGLRKNPYPYIKNADIFFQPSRYEGKSITLDEAKILSKPIVVSDYSTVTDSVRNGENGLVCHMSPEELAVGLEKLIKNSELRCRFVKNLEYDGTSNEAELDKYLQIIHGE